MTWQPTPNQLAQCSHVFIAMWIVAIVILAGSPWWVGCLWVLAWTIPKEFGFDLLIEQDTVVDGLLDSAWYGIGAVLGSLAVILVGAWK